eukprot:212308-Pleurochrysis_carterae.AAC.1
MSPAKQRASPAKRRASPAKRRTSPAKRRTSPAKQRTSQEETSPTRSRSMSECLSEFSPPPSAAEKLRDFRAAVLQLR